MPISTEPNATAIIAASMMHPYRFAESPVRSMANLTGLQGPLEEGAAAMRNGCSDT